MSFGRVEFKKVRVSPFRDGGETVRNVRKESRKFRKGRKDTKTKVIIRISHAVKTSTRKYVRQRRAVEVEE